MLGVVIVSALTCVGLVIAIMLKPQLKIGKLSIATFWIVALVGALFLIICQYISIQECWEGLTENITMNPLKILALFISMAMLSIFLDEVDFFRYIANVVLNKFGKSQKSLFFSLYATISLLTIFTSNDIIILTFTPFICYFCKNAKINALPYLVAEFVAANTWSMSLIVGNPTNIYLSSTYGISFSKYAEIMAVPTIVGGLVALLVLFLIFRKQFRKPIESSTLDFRLKNKFLVWLGIFHLGLCTILLSISSYLNLEMWMITLVFVISLYLIVLIYRISKKEKPTILFKCIVRAPWELVPFVVSMFIIILALGKNGATAEISNIFENGNTILTYGLSSFLVSNVVNNIPMSVLFSEVLSSLSGIDLIEGVFATIVGSNIGALLTPVGALAGIMWTSILKKHQKKISYLTFIKYGILISVPTIFASLGGLWLILHII